MRETDALLSRACPHVEITIVYLYSRWMILLCQHGKQMSLSDCLFFLAIL